MSDSTTTPSKGLWTEQKNKLKAKYPAVTDSDLNYEESRRDEMLALLQTKLHKTRSELAEVMSSL